MSESRDDSVLGFIRGKMLCHKRLTVVATVFLCLGLGVWIQQVNKPSPPTVRQLIRDLQRRDTALHTGWQAVWGSLPGWLTSRCSLLEPRPAVWARRSAPARIAALGEQAGSAVPALIRALKDPDQEVRMSALQVLGGLGTTARSATSALLELFNDPAQDALAGFSQVRAEAASALMAVSPRDARVLSALMAAAQNHQFSGFRAHLIRSLSGVGEPPPELIDALRGWLRSPNPEIRDAAVACVTAVGPSAAELVPNLVELFEVLEQRVAPTRTLQSDAPFSVARSNSLNPVGPPLPPAGVLFSNAAVRTVVRPTFADLTAQTAVPLTARYGFTTTGVEDTICQHRIVEALGSIGPGARQALPLLSSLCASSRTFFRPQATLSKWHIDRDARAACQSFSAQLGPETAAAARCAILGMVKRVGPEALSILTNCLKDPVASVRGDAIQALGALGPAAGAALPELVSLQNDPKFSVRIAATQAVQKISGTK
jgi:HEAT repeat protein